MKITNDFTKEYCLHLSEQEIKNAVACDKETLIELCQEIQRADQWIRDCKRIFTKEVLRK